MLMNKKNVLAALALSLIFVPALLAQPADTRTTTKPEDNYVTEKGFKSKVFDVKYRDANSLASVVRQLGSGFKGALVTPSSEFKTLTVRDFPENLATIEEALKRLDVPSTPRPNIDLQMRVLIASNNSAYVTPATAELPADLKDVVKQLRETLSYRNYELATSVVQRLTETRMSLRGKGTIEISQAPGAAGAGVVTLPYEYSVNQVSFGALQTGGPTIQIGDFTFSTGITSGSGIDNRTQVETALNLRDGEKVVVGTATFGDRALVIVITAKLIN
jgi:hypothetical protein